MSGLIDPAMRVLSEAIDGLSSRQALISGNLANIDTPGYQPKTIDFETALQSEVASMSDSTNNMLPNQAGPSADVGLKTTDPRQFSTAGSVLDGTSSTISGTNENIRNDNNKVDLETEMTNLTETQLKFSADSRLLTAKYAQLDTVLGGH